MKLKAYYFPIILFASMIAGGLTGYEMGPEAIKLKPLGDIFLNLLLTTIVPLIFFSVASSITKMSATKKLWKLMFHMLGIFLFTGIVAALLMIMMVKFFPPAQHVFLNLETSVKINPVNLVDQLVGIFTVTDFTKLFSHQNILPLIFFSILVGFATSIADTKGIFTAVLESGSEISLQVVGFIMYFAPIGFFAYFAVLSGTLGPQLLETYLRVTIIYYVSAFLYFAFAFTLYAYFANGKNGIIVFWKNVFLPMMTSLATCSSAASIPANLIATKKMGVSPAIYETVIPLGAVLHKDGSVLGAILKIAFLYGLFNMDFSSIGVLLTALGVGLLVGSVMGAIPSGGMLGEMLILSFYHFPPQALMMMATISLLIDPLATMLNVTGDSACSMLIARLVEGRDWADEKTTAYANA